MASPAIAAQHTRLRVSDGGSPQNFQYVPGVASVRGLGAGATPINDISDLDSTAKEKLPGLPDEGQLTVAININMANAVHLSLQQARMNSSRREFQIVFSNGKTATFMGYVLTFAEDVNTGDAVRGQMTIEIDGPVARA